MESLKKPAKKRPGRPSLVEGGKWVMITVKVPEELRTEFNLLGASDWLRPLLEASAANRAAGKGSG